MLKYLDVLWLLLWHVTDCPPLIAFYVCVLCVQDKLLPFVFVIAQNRTAHICCLCRLTQVWGETDVYCRDMSGRAAGWWAVVIAALWSETLWSHLSLHAETFCSALFLSASSSNFFCLCFTHTHPHRHTHLTLAFVACERSQYVSIQLSADAAPCIPSCLSGLHGIIYNDCLKAKTQTVCSEWSKQPRQTQHDEHI